MSFMQKIFGNAPTLPQSNPTLPGNIPATPSVATNPNNPAAPIVPEVVKAPVSPLDEFKGMWETDPNVKTPVKEPLFNVDPAKMQQAAKGNNFLSVVTPEIMAAINAGGEGAQAVMLQAMNAMSQKGFGDSAHATTKIVEQALEKQQAKFEAMLPSLMKNQTLSDNLRTANPIFNHPAAAPILDMFKNQVALKNPNATAAELQDMAMKYVVSFAEAANPPKVTAAQKASANETDWSTFLE